MPEKTVVPTSMRGKLLPLFEELWIPSIARPVLFGRMGLACADEADRPSVCSLAIGDFVMFAGDASDSAAAYLIQTVATPCFVLPSTPEWLGLVQAIYGKDATFVTRHDFSNESLERGHLERLASSVSPPYHLEQLDATYVELAAREAWSVDLVGNFESPEDYLRNGLGFCIVEGSGSSARLVAGASSFAVVGDTVEFQVDTHPDHRRRGLAAAAAARLALACMERGLAPHWDAANGASVALARKLGFTLARCYGVLQLP